MTVKILHCNIKVSRDDNGDVEASGITKLMCTYRFVASLICSVRLCALLLSFKEAFRVKNLPTHSANFGTECCFKAQGIQRSFVIQLMV